MRTVSAPRPDGGRRGDDPPPVDEDGLPVDEVLNLFGSDADSIVQVLDEDGAVLGREGGTLPVSQSDLKLAESPGREEFRTIEIEFDTYRMITRHLDGGGAVQVARQIDETNRILGRLGANLAWIGGGLTVLAALAGWWIARRTTKPLRKLSETAHQIAESQDLSTPIPVSGRDEVGTLAESLETMTDALATSREQQRRLVMDAGHELRTPLTSIRANVEFLDRIGGDADPAQRQEIVRAVTSEVDELSDLITELVELATDSRDDLPTERVLLGEVVETAVARFRRRTGRTVQVGVDDTVVLGRAPMLDRALSNLLLNADKFAPGDEPIEVTAASGSVRVRDHGPGFPPEDLPHVFERFYRATATRTMPGSGLGLAIVAQVVERHGGRVMAANDPDGGAIVGFDLPSVH
ncbi:MAG: ATP-binding protein [Actinomycetota bacterium]